MNIRLMEPFPADPAQEQRDLLARAAALAAMSALPEPDEVPSVTYRSAGRVLVVGNAAHALLHADRLAQSLPVTLLLTDAEAGGLPARAYPVFAPRAVAVAGWLGAFEARWQAAGQASQQGSFDLVLDLSASPLIATHQHPHGYYAPGQSEDARRAAVDELLDMVGEFEKPKYFIYKERLCAHSRNQRNGCSACIDICSAGAIAPAGERIRVNPYLCAGCGACTTVCPTGALAYAYPGASYTGTRLKAALRAFAEAGGRDPVVLLHSQADGAALLASHAGAGHALPGRMIPLALHHVASTGIDVWLSAIAYGAAGVTVLLTGAEAPQYAAALDQQMALAQAVLDGLGYAGPHVHLARVAAPDELETALRHAPRGAVPPEPATFHLALDKRNSLDYALEHLLRHAPVPATEIPLPAASPFGALQVKRDACSLCMACVGACPSGALQDGQALPQLRFIEKNCVQCGLCADTCPENAITLVPRLSFAETRNQPVVLNETEPFNCIRCGQPFGTLQMIENMLTRLSSHPAFADHLDRIRMCGDCRVRDMMQPGGELTVQLRRPV
ncbi:4Fe-4S binding protein [Massilia solisilvae]|uniref:4Fe-4S binding protein n=1 Tax=Massilia solisilvae TaxID=1811225 RepID=A0ABT2BGS3_9BURK|nr:4Fe-4S binding protein [Massilia solisilvae]MCS0607724.1 4Fe-4S binding protein [Massilia solisilvae]